METITDTTWLRPLVVNDWGSERTYLVPQGMTTADFSRYGTLGFGEMTGHPYVTAGRYRVRWPDGAEEEVDVQMVGVRESVSDMGHTNEFTDRRPFVVLTHHGVEFRAPLHKLGVLVALLPPE
jgi:hypothetical protein